MLPSVNEIWEKFPSRVAKSVSGGDSDGVAVVLVPHAFDEVVEVVVEAEVWTVEVVVLEVPYEVDELKVELVAEVVELDWVEVSMLVELLMTEVWAETVVEDDEVEVELELVGPLASST